MKHIITATTQRLKEIAANKYPKSVPCKTLPALQEKILDWCKKEFEEDSIEFKELQEPELMEAVSGLGKAAFKPVRDEMIEATKKSMSNPDDFYIKDEFWDGASYTMITDEIMVSVYLGDKKPKIYFEKP